MESEQLPPVGEPAPAPPGPPAAPVAVAPKPVVAAKPVASAPTNIYLANLGSTAVVLDTKRKRKKKKRFDDEEFVDFKRAPAKKRSRKDTVSDGGSPSHKARSKTTNQKAGNAKGTQRTSSKSRSTGPRSSKSTNQKSSSQRSSSNKSGSHKGSGTKAGGKKAKKSRGSSTSDKHEKSNAVPVIGAAGGVPQVNKDPLGRRRKVVASAQRDLGKLITRLYRMDTHRVFFQPLNAQSPPAAVVEPTQASSEQHSGVHGSTDIQSEVTPEAVSKPVVQEAEEFVPCAKSNICSRHFNHRGMCNKKLAVVEPEVIVTQEQPKEEVAVAQHGGPCAKSADCSREGNHRGMCNKKLRVVLYECENNCGFENANISLVEQHELQCTITKSNTIAQNTIPQNTIPQNTIPQNTIQQNTIQQNTIAQDAIAQDTKVPPETRQREKGEMATLFECEFGCGFEDESQLFVEEHEKRCRKRGLRRKRKIHSCSKGCGFQHSNASEMKSHESICGGETFECEQLCGFEHANIAVVEEHEQTCKFAKTARKNKASQNKKIRNIKIKTTGNAGKRKKIKINKDKQNSGKKRKKRKSSSVVVEEKEIVDPVVELKKLLCFDYLFAQYDVGVYFALLSPDEIEELQHLLPVESQAIEAGDFSLATVNWPLFENHFFTMVDQALTLTDKLNEKELHCANRIKTKGKEMIETMKARHLKEMTELGREERIDYVERENKEPAMAKWKKKAYDKIDYTYIEGYVPVSGLSQRESNELMSKLVADDNNQDEGNRWILPEGMKDLNELAVDQKLVGNTKGKAKKKKNGIFMDEWKTKELGTDIEETHTWGIDCFTRKNIWLALESVKNTLRMTPGQINWFIEGILLPSINAQRSEQAHDMSLALNEIAAQCATRQQSRINPRTSRSNTEDRPKVIKKKKYRPGFELLGERVKIFWALDVAWYSGVVTSYDPRRKRKKHQVLYDDGMIEWVDLASDRFMLPNRNTNIFDKSIDDETLMAGVQAILDFKNFMGDHNFAVHPKGHGIVCRRAIRMGEYVGPYCGELYPLWLWEQKEAREDLERKNAKDGKVKLPDFWNMRLERPRKSEKGYDIVYVDAKNRGTFTSRLSHSCNPNCGAMLAVVDGRYVVGVRALREIAAGEEVTIDYNCVTDSAEEFRAAICLCGTHSCRGSFLYMTGAQQYMQIVDRRHRIAHRVSMLFEASLGNLKCDETISENMVYNNLFKQPVSYLQQEHIERLERHGLGEHALQGLPTWLLRYAALALRFVEIEQLELPARLYKEEQTKKGNANTGGQPEGKVTIQQKQIFTTAKNNAKGVAFQRVTNLVVALNRARHRMEIRTNAGFSPDEEAIYGDRESSVVGLVVHKLVSQVEETLSKTTNQYNTITNDKATPLYYNSKRKRESVKSPASEFLSVNVNLGNERKYWIGDRVEAKWCGDDAALYPGWFPGTVLYVYSDSKGSRKSAGASLHLLYDTGEVDRIPMTPDCVRRPHPCRLIEHSVLHEENSEDKTIQPADEDVVAEPPSTTENKNTIPEIEKNTMPENEKNTIPEVEKNTIQEVEKNTIVENEKNTIPENEKNISTTTSKPLAINTTAQTQKQINLSQYFPPPITGIFSDTHQPPIRPLYPDEIVQALWSDRERSVACRLLRLLEKHCTLIIPRWQTSIDTTQQLPYWWDCVTREVTRVKPSEQQLSVTMTYVPDALNNVKMLVEKERAKTVSEAKVLLLKMRDELLKLPTLKGDLSLERKHQKAADILTLLGNTTNFFVVMEPPVIQHNTIKPTTSQDNTSEHSLSSSVIAALLGWLDQKDEELDISKLTGIALLPTVESAFKDFEGHPSGYPRNELIEQLSHRERRYEPWSQKLVKAFPNCAPELVSHSLQNAWPPPTPPLQIFGSPVVDAAFHDNVDFTKLSSRLTGELSDLNLKGLLDQLKKPASTKGNAILEKIVRELKDTQRSSTAFLANDKAFVQPPKPPQVVKVKKKVVPPANWRENLDPEVELLKSKLNGILDIEKPVKVKPIKVKLKKPKKPKPVSKVTRVVTRCISDIITRIVNSTRRQVRTELNKTREAWYNFYQEMHSLGFNFMRIHDLWENMTVDQKLYWRKWKDEDVLHTEEPDEEVFFRGQMCSTPMGEGLVLKRSGPRKYLVAVKPKPGMVVKTTWGIGTIGSRDGEVLLTWGKLYISDLVVLLEFALCVPSLNFFRDCVSKARLFQSTEAIRLDMAMTSENSPHFRSSIDSDPEAEVEEQEVEG